MKGTTVNPHAPKLAETRSHLNHKAAVLTIIITDLLLAMTAVNASQNTEQSVNIRPISDFIEAQGSEASGIPAPYNAGTLAIDPETGLYMAVDYTGLVNQWLEEQSGGAISLGTEVEGAVIERPLPDGRAEVTVLCHARNAYTAVMVPSDTSFTMLFGCDPYEVLLAGAEPALGEAFLKYVFINDAPGAPIPDMAVEGLTFPFNPHPYIRFSLEVSAKGPLREAYGVPEGTPGRAQTTQVGLWRTGEMGVTAGDWPVEHIKLQVLGR